MISLLVLALIALWVVPFLIKAKPSGKVWIRIAAAFFLTAIVGMLGSVILEVWASRFIHIALPMVPDYASEAVQAGLIEELLKFGIAILCACTLKDARPIDYILIFGAAGAGFEATESLATADNLITALIRSVLALHIVWLYFDGIGYVSSREGQKGALLKSLLITILLHFVFDLGLGMLTDFGDNDNLMMIGMLVTLVAVILNGILIFRTIRSVRKAC